MFFRLVCLVLLVFSFSTGSARAQEYTEVSWPNLMHTLMRFNALNLSDQNLIDEYAIITECALYKKFYHDDFKWNEVRKAIRESIQINLPTFPTNYRHDVTMRLKRYDFDSKIFRFDEKSSLHGFNTFSLYAVSGTGCGNAKVEYMPRIFRAVITAPVYLDGLPLSEGDAQTLLSRMQKEKNSDRLVFVRYNFRTVYIEALRKRDDKKSSTGGVYYAQSSSPSVKEIRIDVQLDSIEFFEDPQRTKLVYLYTP